MKYNKIKLKEKEGYEIGFYVMVIWMSNLCFYR